MIKFLSAKSQGKPLAGNLKLYQIQGVEAEVDLRNAETDNSLVLSRETSEVFSGFGLSGELGIWGPLDLVHISGGSMGADMTGVKVQFLGKNWLETSKNVSAALVLGYGSVTSNVEEGQDLELTARDEDTTSEFLVTNQTIALLVGYDLRDSIHLVLGHYIASHNFSGTLDSENNALDGKGINYKGKGSTTSLGVQVDIDHKVLSLEVAHEVLKWDHTIESNLGFINLSVGFRW